MLCRHSVSESRANRAARGDFGDRAAGRRPAASGRAEAEVGVQVNKPGACPGYTLVFPLLSAKTYLIDMEGRVVRTWESRYLAGQEAYLLENGNLLRPAKVADNEAIFAGAGAGGRADMCVSAQLIEQMKQVPPPGLLQSGR